MHEARCLLVGKAEGRHPDRKPGPDRRGTLEEVEEPLGLHLRPLAVDDRWGEGRGQSLRLVLGLALGHVVLREALPDRAPGRFKDVTTLAVEVADDAASRLDRLIPGGKPAHALEGD